MNELFLKLISLAALVLIVIIFILTTLNVFKIKHPLNGIISKNRLELLFFTSLFGTVGSILLSVYFKLEACDLCWYQRVFLFTIPVITLIALIKKHTYAAVYAFWLAVIGLSFSLYHSLLQSKIFAPDAVFCNPNSAIDCSVPAFTYFGFVTIPVIAFSVFLLLIYIAYEPNQK